MTAKQRLLAAMRLEQPDSSVMIPCRMTGRRCWDVLLYNDPAIVYCGDQPRTRSRR